MGGNISKETCSSFSDQACTLEEKGKCKDPWYSDVEIDSNGCRKFDCLPPPGVHPRLFFTPSEIPRISRRFTDSEIGPALHNYLKSCQDGFLKTNNLDGISSLSEDEKIDPEARETIDIFFKSDYNRNVNMLGAYAYGILYDDSKLAEKAKRFAIFFSKVILRAQHLAIENGVREKPYDVWHNNEWNVSVQTLFGGTCFALLYDIMFNDLSADEQGIVRKAITTAIQGRRGWGMGCPSRRIQSNWAAYHGDLYTLSAVVEGEEGADHDVHWLYEDLMIHYINFAFYDSGHPIEDAYALNLGLREGSLCFLAMARRGFNVFNHPHYKKIWSNWLPYALEPNNSGRIYGGSSGNFWFYPTSAVIAKYMFPKDRVVDHVYRRFISEDGAKYSRLAKGQCRLPVLAFAIPVLPTDLEESEIPKQLDLPLNFKCQSRGKLVMRSDWSDSCLWFTFDARPDCYLIGHDTCSRGAFVVNSGGRSWGFCPEWNVYTSCSDFSLPTIDSVGQEIKAPFVKMIEIIEEEGFTYASADLTYAYQWKWSNWARKGADLTGQGFEKEVNDPRTFGHNVWWAPHKIYDEHDVGFVGLYVWRKRIAEVQTVTRSAILVRAKKPFVVIADNVKKDDDEHEYCWRMTTAYDIELEGFDGIEAILKEKGGKGRRFAIRNVGKQDFDLQCTFRKIIKENEKVSEEERPGQVIFSCTGGEGVQFMFLLYSRDQEEIEGLQHFWSEDESVLSVVDRGSGESSEICTNRGEFGEITMKVTSGCK